MHTRDYVKSVFASEGFYRMENATMKSFLKSLDDAPADCWPEFIERFRTEYYELFDQVVPPLLFGKDKLVRTILARSLDPKRKQEKTLTKHFVERADTEANMHELREIARKKDSTLNGILLKKKRLPGSVLRCIDDADKQAAGKAKEGGQSPKRTGKKPSAQTAGAKKRAHGIKQTGGPSKRKLQPGSR